MFDDAITTRAGHDRYHRQRILPGIGADGQQRLLAAHAVIVGCGALGCNIADMLTRAGVGTLTLIDRDVVAMSNLGRQVLFCEADIGIPKVEAAARRLAAINRDVRVYGEAADLTAENAEPLCGVRADPPAVLVDGTDNFRTRYLLNDLSVKHSIPLVYGGAVGTRGTQATFIPGASPARACLRCIWPDEPAGATVDTCDTAGVLGPAVGIVGAMQAAEAIKLIVGHAERCGPNLESFDVWSNERRSVPLSKLFDPQCPCCGGHNFEFLAMRAGETVRVLCGRDSVQLSGLQPPSLDAAERSLSRAGQVSRFATSLRVDLTEPSTHGRRSGLSLFEDGRIIVHGTSDTAAARALASRLLGV